MTIKEYLSDVIFEMQREAIEAGKPVTRQFETADGWIELTVKPAPGKPQVFYRDDSQETIELKREPN